jgi:hypothetical protein
LLVKCIVWLQAFGPGRQVGLDAPLAETGDAKTRLAKMAAASTSKRRVMASPHPRFSGTLNKR